METDESQAKQTTFIGPKRGSIKMVKTVASLLLALNMICQLTQAAMSLPDGIENILGFVPKSNFQCERDGYFGDIDNDCRIFHLCQRQVSSNGKTEWRHWTYACGNQTMFNQLTLTCAFVDEAIPCKHASQFQYLNEVIHKPREPFLTDADVTSGISYYSNRVMSEGARARAFEDSNLMAQLGGQATFDSIAGSNQQLQRHWQESVASNQFRNPEDTSNDYLNTLTEAILPSLSDSFQTHNRHQTEFTTNQRPQDLIINHQLHLQHHPTNVQPQLGPNNIVIPSHDSLLQENFQSQHQQLLHQQQQFNTANQQPQPSLQPTEQLSSFDFTINTNHQAGNPSATTVISENHSTQPVTTAISNQRLLITTTGPESTTQLSQTITSSTNNLSPEAPSEPSTLTVAVPQFTTTQTIATVKPTELAPSTTTLVLPVTSERSPQLRRRQIHENSQASRTIPKRQKQLQQKRQQANRSQLVLSMPTFQSARLSSTRQSPSTRSNRSDSALVMRGQAPITASPPIQRQATLKPVRSELSRSVGSQETTVSSANTFWRRSLDTQFTAPKFDSLLIRRRV